MAVEKCNRKTVRDLMEQFYVDSKLCSGALHNSRFFFSSPKRRIICFGRRLKNYIDKVSQHFNNAERKIIPSKTGCASYDLPFLRLFIVIFT